MDLENPKNEKQQFIKNTVRHKKNKSNQKYMIHKIQLKTFSVIALPKSQKLVFKNLFSTYHSRF